MIEPLPDTYTSVVWDDVVYIDMFVVGLDFQPVNIKLFCGGFDVMTPLPRRCATCPLVYVLLSS